MTLGLDGDKDNNSQEAKFKSFLTSMVNNKNLTLI